MVAEKPCGSMSISLPDGAAAQWAVELRTAAPPHAAIVINLAAPVRRDIPDSYRRGN